MPFTSQISLSVGRRKRRRSPVPLLGNFLGVSWTVLRPAHQQDGGHHLNKHSPDPRRHAMSRRTPAERSQQFGILSRNLVVPEMHVEHSHGDADGEGDQDHGEEQVLPQERHRQRCGRNYFRQQQEEDGQGEQDGDAKGHLGFRKLI